MVLTEEQKKTQVEPKDAVLFKIIPNKSNPDTFTIEACSTTGVYDEAIDKLWLVLKTLKVNEEQEVRWRVTCRNTD